jgi:hypothetical protein
MKNLIITLVLGFNFTLTSSVAQVYENVKILTGPGPEDFVVDTFVTRPRFIVSCNERRDNQAHYGEIIAIDLEFEKPMILPRLNEPQNFLFNPHGIDIIHDEDATYLLVVNHQDETSPLRHQIVIYQISENFITYLDTVGTPKYLKSPNDVSTRKDGLIWVSNDTSKRGAKMEVFLSRKKSFIAAFKSGEAYVAVDKLAFPNGVLLTDTAAYYTTTRQNKVFKSLLDSNGKATTQEVIAKIKGADNLMYNNGKLYTTSHPKPIKFLKHLKNPEKKSPTDVYEIDPVNKTKKLIYTSKGDEISAGSTALVMGEYLYISQVFDSFILKVKIK